MKKRLSQLGIGEIALYTFLTLAVNFVSVYFVHAMFYFTSSEYAKGNSAFSMSAAAVIITFILPVLLLIAFMKRAVNMQYDLSDREKPCFVSFLENVSVGESIRLVVSVFSHSGYFTAYPALRIFTFMSDTPQNTLFPEFSVGFASAFVLLFIYLVYIALQGGLLFLIYRAYWRQKVRESSDSDSTATDKYGEKRSTVVDLHAEALNREKRSREYSKKAESRSHAADYAREAAVNTMLVFAAAFVVGMTTNTLLLLVGYVTSIPLTFRGMTVGYSHETDLHFWFAVMVISLLACALSLFVLIRGVGIRSAEFIYANKQSEKLDVPMMLISVFGGVLLHGALCVVTAFVDFAYLFFASPVQYIARLLGDSKRSLFNEESFDFTPGDIVASIAIYITVIGIGCLLGYICGHKKFRSIQADKEKIGKAMNYSRNAEKAEYTYQVEDKPKIRKTALSEKAMRQLTMMNRRKKLVYLSFTLIYAIVDIILWYKWGQQRGGMLTPNCAFFPLLLVIPFYPFRVHEKIFGKSYYATVISHEIDEINVSGKGAGAAAGRMVRTGGVATKKVNVLKLRLKRGDTVALRLKLDSPAKYEKDDVVYKLSAFMYPVQCSWDEELKIFCPSCGASIDRTHKKCPICKTTLVPKEKW